MAKKSGTNKKPLGNEKPQGFMKNELVVVIAVVCLGAGYLLNALVGDFILQPRNRSLGLSPVASTSPDQTLPNEIIDSIKVLEEQASENPESANAWTQLGNAYFDSDQYQMAVLAYENSLDLEPENPNVWTDLGIMYRRLGDPKQALKCFDTARQKDPNHIMSRYNKGVVLLHDIGDEKAAAEAWEEVLALDPAYISPTGIKVKDMVESLQ